MDLHELGAGAYPEFITHTDEFLPRPSKKKLRRPPRRSIPPGNANLPIGVVTPRQRREPSKPPIGRLAVPGQ